MTPIAFRWGVFAAAILAGLVPGQADADQLYGGGRWAGVASDNKAQDVGDVVLVLILEAASSTNRVRNRSSKETAISGELGVGGIDEDAGLRLRGGYTGSGEAERSDRLVATMTAQVIEVLPNGDLLIEGRQSVAVNGEERIVAVRGRIRPLDISTDNTIVSSRLANAQIDYDGKGFVSRSAKPGLVNRIFSFLGIG